MPNMRRVCLLIGLVLLAPVSVAFSADIRDEVRDLINKERTKRKLKTVSLDSKLTSAALDYAAYMAKHKKFSHNADGRSPGQRISAKKYKWSACGEIIAKGYPNAASVVKGWMNSPGHRAIILSKSYTEIGVGKAGSYWVVDFAKPR